MANSAFEHTPSFTIPSSITTANSAAIWSAVNNLGQSTIILDSGGNGRIGISGDTNIITLTSGTVTVAGLVAATTLTGAGAGITALNGTQVTSGTLPAARIAADSIVEAKLNVSNAPTNGQVLTARDGVAGGFTWEAASGGIASVAADTTPQLGGNLDLNNSKITSASNDPVIIQPAGNGAVRLGPSAMTLTGTGGTTKAPVQILCGTDSGLTSHRANCLELYGPTGNGLNEPANNGTSDSGGGGQLHICSSTEATSSNSHGQNLGGRIVFGGKYRGSHDLETPFASIAGLKQTADNNETTGASGYFAVYTRGTNGNMDERINVSNTGLTMIKITNTGGGEMFECRNLSNNAGAASVQIFSLVDAGNNVVRHAQFRVHKDSNTSGALHTRFDWYQAHNGSENMTMRQYATGVLSVDLGGSGSGAQVDVFDTYDDPIEIQRYAHSVAEAPTIAGITLEQRDANRERMVELGILYEKDTGSGYMMNIQPLTRLLAGGIYQNRFRMDEYHTQHEERLHQLENQMKALMDGKDN